MSKSALVKTLVVQQILVPFTGFATGVWLYLKSAPAAAKAMVSKLEAAKRLV